MTREIKFRAWNKNLGGWNNAITGRTEFKPFIIYQITNLSIEENNHLDIQQFTGLYDKNNKELYEGDIVKYKNNIAKVSWNKLAAGFWFEGDTNLEKETIPACSVEIIGNIYENPELLVTKEK